VAKACSSLAGGGHGDLNLRIQVRIPEKFSGEERTLYQQLRSWSQTVKKNVGGNSTGQMLSTDYC
jgi:DnaJ-class molecular chaperone